MQKAQNVPSDYLGIVGQLVDVLFHKLDKLRHNLEHKFYTLANWITVVLALILYMSSGNFRDDVNRSSSISYVMFSMNHLSSSCILSITSSILISPSALSPTF